MVLRVNEAADEYANRLNFNEHGGGGEDVFPFFFLIVDCNDSVN